MKVGTGAPCGCATAHLRPGPPASDKTLYGNSQRLATYSGRLPMQRQLDFSNDAMPEQRENDPALTRDIEEARVDAPVDLERYRGVIDAPRPFVAPFAEPNPQGLATPIKQDQTPAHGPRQLHAWLAFVRARFDDKLQSGQP